MVSRLGGIVEPMEVEQAMQEGIAFAADPGVRLAPTSDLPESAQEPAPPALSLIRLLEDVPLLSSPLAGAEGRGTVPSGMRVTVLTESDDFIEVVTPDDRFGWVSRLARFEPVARGAG